jgi:hypothetical protein
MFGRYLPDTLEMPMRPILLAAFALAACVPAPDATGAVTAFNGSSVTIRAGGDYSLANAGKGFKPTPAVVAQAQGVCPGAKFASGVPVSEDSWLIDYLFICP